MPKTVLVIEDDDAMQTLLQLILDTEGYKVVAAYDGLSGLSQLDLVKPDVIILDMGLPLMDGRTFIDAYYQMPPPHAPIIGISAYFISMDTVAKLAAFIKKPFDLTQLRYILRNVLNDYSNVGK